MTVIPPGTYAIDPAHTDLGFTVRHLMSKVRGHFEEFDGTIEVAESLADSKLHVDVKLASIDTRNQDRDAHLRSSDFFDVESNTSMTFASTQVIDRGDDKLTVIGDLTIKDVTEPVELSVEFLGEGNDPWGGVRLGFEATGELSRRDFGVDFNIPVEGDKLLIGDRVRLELAAEAVLRVPSEVAS